jgi:hypothetical protein
MRPSGSLDIIIVNWNAGDLLRHCLESIEALGAEIRRVERIVVVDNASTDGSMDDLDRLRLPLLVIGNSRNLGFAAGCNLGAAGSSADYLLFLNPDTVLTPGSLSRPTAFLDDPTNGDVGVVGIQLLDGKGTVQPSCARFPTPLRSVGHMLGLDRLAPGIVTPHFMREWDHKDTRSVDQVMGAFFMTRRTVFETTEGFDERFFVYFEEVDYCKVTSQLGFRTVHFSGALAWHHGGGTTREIPALRLFLSLRSRTLYLYKHHRRLPASLFLASVFLLEVPVRVCLALLQGSASAAAAALRAGVRMALHLPSILRVALRTQTHTQFKVSPR